jgi:hypothetical protein
MAAGGAVAVGVGVGVLVAVGEGVAVGLFVGAGVWVAGGTKAAGVCPGGRGGAGVPSLAQEARKSSEVATTNNRMREVQARGLPMVSNSTHDRKGRLRRIAALKYSLMSGMHASRLPCRERRGGPHLAA